MDFSISLPHYLTISLTLAMPKVEFIRLRKPEKAKHLCELADEFYRAGGRVLVTVADDNQGVTLDRFLWTWQKGTSSRMPMTTAPSTAWMNRW